MTARIQDRDMFASSGFSRNEYTNLPECLKKMDEAEQKIVDEERQYIEGYPPNHVGIGAIYGAVMGSLGGLTVGAISANPVVPLITAVGGGIAGFQLGRQADVGCCSHILEEVGEINAHIPEDRLNRIKDKIELIHDVREQTSDDKGKRTLDRAEEHFQVIRDAANLKKVNRFI